MCQVKINTSSYFEILMKRNFEFSFNFIILNSSLNKKYDYRMKNKYSFTLNLNSRLNR